MSLIEVGAEATALASPANTEPFIEHIKKYPPDGGLILSLDNDQNGQETTAKLAQELKALDIPFYEINISEPYNDPNEALTEDREAFARAVQNALNTLTTQEEQYQEMSREEYQQTSAASYIQDFMDGVGERVNTSFIPTGFERLDMVLDGGLYEGLYLLERGSSLGKTALTLQIADQVARSGLDVLVFSLGAARTELIARSLSRLTFIHCGAQSDQALTARGITTRSRRHEYSPDEQELLASSIETYGQYADRFYIHEGRGDWGVQQIAATITRHQRLTGNSPLVMVDCLQLLAPHDPRASDQHNRDKAVLELKRVSRDHKTPVVVISSPDRHNSGNQVIAGFQSGATAAAADVILELQVRETLGQDGLEGTAALKPGVSRVELRIRENRWGAAGLSIEYDYYPLFNCFVEGK